MLSEIELRAIAQDIVNKSKATAHVDQGTLKRSIKYTIRRGVVEFSQMFYGIYSGKKDRNGNPIKRWEKNSQLEEFAKKYMPKGTPYKIKLIDTYGGVFEIGKTQQGRSTQKESVAAARNSSTERIKDLIRKEVKRKKEEKENGKKED